MSLLFMPRSAPRLAATLSYTRAVDRPICHNYIRGADPWATREKFDAYSSNTETTLHNVALETTYDIADSWRITSISGLMADRPRWRYLVTPGTTPGSTSEGPTRECNLSQELRLNFASDRVWRAA